MVKGYDSWTKLAEGLQQPECPEASDDTCPTTMNDLALRRMRISHASRRTPKRPVIQKWYTRSIGKFSDPPPSHKAEKCGSSFCLRLFWQSRPDQECEYDWSSFRPLQPYHDPPPSPSSSSTGCALCRRRPDDNFAFGGTCMLRKSSPLRIVVNHPKRHTMGADRYSLSRGNRRFAQPLTVFGRISSHFPPARRKAGSIWADGGRA